MTDDELTRPPASPQHDCGEQGQGASDWESLEWRVELSIMYHSERRRFFEVWSNTARAISFAAGSGALAAIYGSNKDTAVVLSALAASLQGMDLIVGFSRKIWMHSELVSKFLDLANKMTLADRSDAELNRLITAKREIEKSEPPCKPYVVVWSEINLCRRNGIVEGRPKMNWFQRLLKNYLPDV